MSGPSISSNCVTIQTVHVCQIILCKDQCQILSYNCSNCDTNPKLTLCNDFLFQYQQREWSETAQTCIGIILLCESQITDGL